MIFHAIAGVVLIAAVLLDTFMGKLFLDSEYIHTLSLCLYI